MMDSKCGKFDSISISSKESDHSPSKRDIRRFSGAGDCHLNSSAVAPERLVSPSLPLTSPHFLVLLPLALDAPWWDDSLLTPSILSCETGATPAGVPDLWEGAYRSDDGWW